MPVNQSFEELQLHLREQIDFLRTSISAYDSGNKSEAKRLSVTLRLLLHDTRQSKSLLGQLNLKDRPFYDTSNFAGYNKAPWDVAVYTGLIGHCLDVQNNRIEFIPFLDPDKEHKMPNWVDFQSWWEMVVIKDELGNIFSRRDLVLTMANKDGGAHIDPVITDKYADITRKNSIGWKGAMGNATFQPIPHLEKAAIRQIAHEVLKSLDSDYTYPRDLQAPYFATYNVIVWYESLKKKFGRNESCPCGSGKKYKNCHGKFQVIDG